MSLLARLKGTIEEKGRDTVLIFVGGLGFEVIAPLSTLQALPDIGEEATLRTFLYLREGSIGLYGFLSDEEQRMFELLLTVTGVGPRAALNCLSLLSVAQLAQAIGAGDGDSLRRVPGVGRKTADRILLELKNRVKDFGVTPSAARGGGGRVDDEVVEALMFYGYSTAEAVAAVATLPRDGESSVEERTLMALQYFAPRSER